MPNQTKKTHISHTSDLRPKSTVDTEVANSTYHSEKFPEEWSDTLFVPRISPEVVDSVNTCLSEMPEGKYAIVGGIGVGGMKSIVRASDRDTGRDVAMAEMREEKKKGFSKQFVREARLAANLEHPNIVPVHEIGIKKDGSPYFTMKLVRGENLAYIIDRLDDEKSFYSKQFNLHHRLRIFIKVCDAIAFAHSRGVIHLDLKPENVQIGEFGEVLVLDWGLAKLIGSQDDEDEPPQDNQTKNPPNDRPLMERIGNGSVEITMDGVIKGTPGYMAPEQVAGKNKEKDERTDIYALGAILYSLLTFQKPVDGDNPQIMMLNTLEGNIPTPRKRAPDKNIPKSLEAVVVKALALRKENRYQTVKELSNDIDAFLGGFATSAEKATLLKRLVLMVKRHKALASVVTALIAISFVFGAYVLAEYQRQWGNWTEAFSRNFTTHSASLDGLIFLNPEMNAAVPPWRTDTEGLEMKPMEWMWLDDVAIRGDCKIVATIKNTGAPGQLEICLNSEKAPLLAPTFVPRGYSFQFGAWYGRGDTVSKNSVSQPPDSTVSSPSRYQSGAIHKIVVTRRNGRISMTVDGEESVSMKDFFPLRGHSLSGVGIRSHALSTSLVSLRVYRWALPEATSPLVAGDTLLEAHLPNEAVAKYLTIAHDSTDPEIVANAFLRAFLAASSNNIADQNKIMREVKAHMIEQFPSSEQTRELLEQEVLFLWKNKRFDEALNHMPTVFRTFPHTRVALKILQIRHYPLPRNTAQELLAWIAKTQHVRSINIANLGVTSLEPLSKMKLNALNCSRNNIRDLSPLKKMPLHKLRCDQCGLTSLAPLKGMNLHNLIISGNDIADLSPLKDMPLERLRCRLNRITDISPLKGAPLMRLECGGNAITSLKPLARAPLVFLGCRINKIKSLAPLKGMRLFVLDCQRNPIENISPLAGMPLRELYINGCPVDNITALKSCPALETLAIPDHCGDISFLKTMPMLKFLDTKWTVPMKTAKEFWAERELQK